MLKLKNISKAYDERALVLLDVNLDVATGESVAIVGESGCGKSTQIPQVQC